MTKSDMTVTDRLGTTVAETVIRWRWIVILLTLLGLGAAMSGAPNLAFSNNYRVFFSEENPDLQAFDDFQATYTKNDNILFVLQPGQGKVFTPEMTAAIERLTQEAWKTPFAIRVDSVSNFQHSWADGDDLTVEDLVRDGASMTPEELARRNAVALAEPLLLGNLISPDSDTTGINVTVQYPEKSLTEVPQAVAYARALADEIRADHPDLTIMLTGVSMLNNAFGEAGQLDAATLVPAMYAVLLVVMFVMLRSFSGTFATLLVIAFSVMAAMGLAGHAGIKLTPVSVTAPTIILTLAIADSIHILVSMLHAMRAGMDKITALKEAIRINFLAVSITSITTIIGFLALNFSDAPPFNDLGNITAMGIAAAWGLSLFFLPAVVSLLPMRPRDTGDKESRLQRSLDRLADFVIDRRKPVLVGSLIAVAGLAVMVPRIDLNDEFVKYFDTRVEFRNHAEFGMEHLNGIYLLEFSVPSGEAGGISDPEYLKGLEAFTEWLRLQPEVTHVYSYADIIKRLNKNMNADDPDFYRTPDQRDLAAQYLLLFELSLPFGLDLNDRVSVDKSATRVTISMDDLPTATIRAFTDRAEQWIRDSLPKTMETRATSATVMFSHISERNIVSMIEGNIIAIVLISLIMIAALRSVGLGALSIVPNTVPIIMTFGIWALLVGQVGMAAATVTATSLGIVVDDTVHFLTKYLRARREKSMNREDAVRYAFHTVGSAIAVTTAILAAGFAVLAFSTFKINAEMGLLTAIAIVIAMIMDFLLLPALLLSGKDKKQEIDSNAKVQPAE
ncbi:MAG: efflux RND transporter permease subunit [Magnetovibrionaceae bacterium]